MTLTVRTERGGEVISGYHDCMLCADLMVLDNGGVPVPRGSAERERFEDATGLPESQQEQGLPSFYRCDIASHKLYGVAAHDASQAELPALLADPQIAVALNGVGNGISIGWHAITVKNGLLYDPMHAEGSLGLPISTATVLAFHRALPVASRDIRWTREGEFAMPTFKVPTTTTRIGTAVILDDPAIRLISMTTNAQFDPPAGATYPVYGGPLDVTWTSGGQTHTEAAYILSLNGEPYAALVRNVTFQSVVATFAIKGTVDGTGKVTFS